jgi:lipoate-protein ligase A
MNFRLIPFKYFNAYMNMALDETIMDGIRSGRTPPTIRLYGWEPSAVSIGYFQGLQYEVNQGVCQNAGVDIVRRITGGGAVYHDRDGEVTYSILGPMDLFPSNVLESYNQVCENLITALESLGIPSSFQPVNDIAVEGRKISGNAQTRRRGVFLQHGTVLYTVDVDKMFSLLNVSEQKIADKLIRSVKKRVTSVKEWKAVTIQDLVGALQGAFLKSFSATLADYSDEEITLAEHLADEKYRSIEWNAMR